MEKVFEVIPQELFNFVVIAVFSLIVGLSQRTLHTSHPERSESLFGSDRTFTFIGILGYILWIVDGSRVMYITGLIMLAVFLTVNFYFKIQLYKDFGLTTVLVALVTYLFAAVLSTQPFWFFLLVYVTLLVLTELKKPLAVFATRVSGEEFITLGKFLAIAGIILPIVPDKPIVSFLDLTPYRIWLAAVVMSSISYLSYLLRKFVFHDSGIIVTGVLGGLYSSTMTTIILSRQSRNSNGSFRHFSAAIVLATAMMYLRIAVLMAIFNQSLFNYLFPWLGALFVIAAVAGVVILYYNRSERMDESVTVAGNVNPLEFRIALIFTALFVAFSFITWFTIQRFGTNGLQVLAYIIGMTDIDPFLINLFNGRYSLGMDIIAVATMQAIVSNNILKLVYTLILGHKKIRYFVAIGMVLIIMANFLFIFLL